MKTKKVVETIKKITNRIINSSWLPLIIGGFLFIKSIIFYKNTICINDNIIEKQLIIGTVPFIITIICILEMLPNKTRAITSIIIDLIVSVILFGDHSYYRFSNNVLSVAQISNLQYGEEIMKTLPQMLSTIQLLYFIDLIIFFLLLIFKIIKIQKGEKSNKRQKIIKLIPTTTIIILLCFIEIKYIEKGTQKSYNKDMQVKETTIYGYHISDMINEINYKNQAKYKTKEEMMQEYEKLKTEYQEQYGEDIYNLQGILQGKNVIILQLESVQEFVINKMINGKQITPNFNEFLRENIEFSNMYMQSYSTTADSEHSMITSIYPMENGMSFSKYYTNKYDDIFSLFNNTQYHTSFMHGNYSNFWNRGNVYSKLNLDSLVFKGDFEDTSENINGDLSDELLYKQAIQKIKTYNKPFFTTIVSASSHTPYTLEGIKNKEQKVNIDVGKYKDTYLGNYLEAMNYADYAFGIFIEELKKENIYENTAILVYGDHNGLTMYDEELKDFLQQINPDINDIELKLNYIRVMCGLRIPGIENLKIEKPVSKLDIKPTFAYLLGKDDGVSLGTNMLESKDFVSLNNERIVTNKYYYDGKWYEIETGKEISEEELEEKECISLKNKYENMKTELNISKSISIYNLLK